MGPVPCERAYYYCGRCGQGLFPWDQAVGLTPRSFTPATERLVCLAGTLSDGFEEAATKVLPEMAGLKIAETTVQRTTEAAGKRVADHLHAGGTFAFPQHWDWHKDALGRACAYVGLDLTGVRQQAEDGGKAEGRMPYVAMIFNPVPELPEDSPYRPPPKARMQVRYLSGLYDLDQLGLELRKQAGQVGMDKAEVWIGLTDGGNGLEEFVRRNFPREPVLILDFWHASEYLTELGQALHPSDEETRQCLVGEWCRTLKREGGQRVLEILQELSVPGKLAVQEKYDTTLGYFRNNVHRMDYPTYVTNGWSIGSGAVESACKTVVGQRLKLAACVGGNTGPTLCAICGHCSKAKPGNGKHSGAVPPRRPWLPEHWFHQRKRRSHPRAARELRCREKIFGLFGNLMSAFGLGFRLYY
jgi:hypothetical protein